MPITMDLEISVAAYKVVRDLLEVKKGESVLITIRRQKKPLKRLKQWEQK